MQALNDKYLERGVRAIVINVLENPDLAASWAKKLGWNIPVLLDVDGRISASYAPE